MATREQQKEEALKRLKLLKAHENVLNDLKQGIVNASEFGGILYWLNEEEQKIVDDFEKETNYMVYHAIRNVTKDGERHLTLLYVSEDEEDWPIDQRTLTTPLTLKLNGRNRLVFETLAYVYNRSDSQQSEFGYIVIRPMFGGVKRLA